MLMKVSELTRAARDDDVRRRHSKFSSGYRVLTLRRHGLSVSLVHVLLQ